VNQDSINIEYPNVIKNKISVIGFIYTHCPDICPMTTHNMQLSEEKLSKDEIKNVKFILISFDPLRDTPSILKKYAEVRGLDMDHWELLTGDEKEIKILLKEYDVKAINDDTTYNDKGEPNYFMIHTDRISLVDTDGNLRKNYRGSLANPEELSNDIKNLE
jgi:protein SCO1/2